MCTFFSPLPTTRTASQHHLQFFCLYHSLSQTQRGRTSSALRMRPRRLRSSLFPSREFCTRECDATPWENIEDTVKHPPTYDEQCFNIAPQKTQINKTKKQMLELNRKDKHSSTPNVFFSTISVICVYSFRTCCS